MGVLKGKIKVLKAVQIKKICYISVVLLLMAIFIYDPGKYVKSVYGGLLLYAQTVLPSLFPFFFLTFLLTHIGGVGYISKVFFPLAKIYRINKDSSFIIFMSYLSGYPIGAKLTLDYYKDGLITKEQAETLSAVASTSGPVFIIGTVGAMLLNDVKIGVTVYFCHIAGSLINGLIYAKSTAENLLFVPIEENAQNLLKEAVYSSVISVLCVGGFIAISSFIIEICRSVGLIGLLSRLLGYLNNDMLSEGIAVSLFEMTNGIYVLSSLNDPRALIPAVTFAVSFGGISVLLQCFSYLAGCKIKLGKFLLQKITGAFFATVIAYVVSLSLFPVG